MYIKQSELLWGLDSHFIKEFIESAMKKTYPEGYTLFTAGEPADLFFILLKGSIRLSVGDEDKTVYIVERAGEAFAWSSLVDMPKYSASAQCVKESMVMVFAKEFVQSVAEADPDNGLRFYRRLARMLGKRLIYSYNLEIEGVTDGIEYTFEKAANI
jgi:CRP/FNR family transcriptional regulator, cyclic AMP receptor protein